MRKQLRLLAIGGAVMFFLPVVLGLIDGWFWLLFGKQLTWIDWCAPHYTATVCGNDRALIALVLMFPGIACIVAAEHL